MNKVKYEIWNILEVEVVVKNDVLLFNFVMNKKFYLLKYFWENIIEKKIIIIIGEKKLSNK